VAEVRRSKTTAVVLAIFLGLFGAHRYYIGQSGIGTTMLLASVLSCGMFAPVVILVGWIDALLMLGGSSYKTSSGEPIIWE